MTVAYYNDNDPFACEWLRNLIAAGHLPDGDVDGRPIEEVSADDIRGYSAVHLFAGIGGWAYALRLAGWPDDRPVWTGSCPCQPLSGAGKRQGETDARHLWPAFFNLIAELRPPVVFGEQVASPLGREWLAAVRADLEISGYAVGAADLAAASVGAPHVRQRLFWVADAERHIREAGRAANECGECAAPEGTGAHGEPGRCRTVRGTPWTTVDFVPCADGKERPTQPGLRPLAHGVPGRVGRLRGYGNAIVPQVAAAFVAADVEASTRL